MANRLLMTMEPSVADCKICSTVNPCFNGNILVFTGWLLYGTTWFIDFVFWAVTGCGGKENKIISANRPRQNRLVSVHVAQQRRVCTYDTERQCSSSSTGKPRPVHRRRRTPASWCTVSLGWPHGNYRRRNPCRIYPVRQPDDML